MKFYVVEQCKRNGKPYKKRRFIGGYYYTILSAAEDDRDWHIGYEFGAARHTYVVRTLVLEDEG